MAVSDDGTEEVTGKLWLGMGRRVCLLGDVIKR